MIASRLSLKGLASGLVAVAMAAGVFAMTAQPAEAGWRRGGYAPAYAGRGYYGPRAYGPRYGYYNRGYYNRGYYGGGWNPGAALAIGAVTGLAIGALAAPQYYYVPAPAPVYVQPNCFWQYYPNGTRAWVCT